MKQNLSLVAVSASLIMITSFVGTSNAEESSRIEMCETLGGTWDSTYAICDNLSESYCGTMSGEYAACKAPEYSCSLDDQTCIEEQKSICVETCIFEEILIPSEILVSFFGSPVCSEPNCYSHFNSLVQIQGIEFTAKLMEAREGFQMFYITNNVIVDEIFSVEETPTVIMDISPYDDGSIFLRLNTDFYYPMFMSDEAVYTVYVDGVKTDYIQYNHQDIEILISEHNYQIRIGSPHHGIDLVTLVGEPAKFSYEDSPDRLPEEFRKTLKAQIDYDLNPNDILCPNPDHVLTKRTNGKLACVETDTAERFGWYKYSQN